MKPKLPRFKRAQTQKPNLKLQQRDLDIIKAVYDYRFLSSEQIRALITGSDQTITRRLQKLYHNQYLDRLQGWLSQPIIYALGNKGAEALTQYFDIDRGKINWLKKNAEVKEYYKDHILMIAGFRIILTLALKGNPSAKLIEWVSETTLKGILQEGKDKRPALIPDAFFTIEDKGDWMFFFLEADRSTMTNERFFKKMQSYWYFYKQNQHKTKFQIDSFRVLTITKSEARRENLRTITKLADDRQTGSPMFWFATEKDYNLQNPETILGPVWQTPKDDSVHHLLE